MGNEKRIHKTWSRQDRIESMLANVEIEIQSTVLQPLQQLWQQHREARASNQLSEQMSMIDTANIVEVLSHSFVSQMKEI